MQLRVLADEKPPNLKVISQVLEEVGGEEVVEFSKGQGAGVLRWSHPDSTRYHVHIAIPLHWLTQEEKTDVLKQAARNFADGVRFAARRTSGS